MEQQKPAGAGFLKVVGILMIVFGGIGLVISGLAVAVTTTIAAGLAGMDDGGLVGLFNLMSFTAIVGAILQLVTGILGVVFSKKPEKAMVCLIAAVVVLLLNVFSAVIVPLIAQGNPIIATVGLASAFEINFVGLFTGAIMPVLFIIGAMKNKA